MNNITFQQQKKKKTLRFKYVWKNFINIMRNQDNDPRAF